MATMVFRGPYRNGIHEVQITTSAKINARNDINKTPDNITLHSVILLCWYTMSFTYLNIHHSDPTIQYGNQLHHSRTDKCKDHSNYAESPRFGKNTLYGSHYKKRSHIARNLRIPNIFWTSKLPVTTSHDHSSRSGWSLKWHSQRKDCELGG